MRSLRDLGDPLAPHRALLARPHLSIISSEPDHELDELARTITSSVRIGGHDELDALLEHLLAAHGAGAPTGARTLDLLGHSTARTAQLRLGDWVIDAADPQVAAWIRALADREVLRRLGITAIRLLGCRTADTVPACATICRLAELSGVEVFGTRHLLYGAHYDEHGLRDCWEFLLVGSTALERATRAAAVPPVTAPGPHRLDLDALPALPLAARAACGPRCVATPVAARQILQLVRRDAGAPLPGPWITLCELALPSATREGFHVAHVLLDGAFLRFYPDGVDAPGVAYPVEDVRELRRVMAGLSPPAAG